MRERKEEETVFYQVQILKEKKTKRRRKPRKDLKGLRGESKTGGHTHMHTTHTPPPHTH